MLERLLEAAKRLWNLLPNAVRVLILSWTNHQLYNLMLYINRQIEALSS